MEGFVSINLKYVVIGCLPGRKGYLIKKIFTHYSAEVRPLS